MRIQAGGCEKWFLPESNMMTSKKPKKGGRHAGLDPASLYFQALPDSGLRPNDESLTFFGFIKRAN